MRLMYLSIFALCFLLVGCSEERKKPFQKKAKKYQPFLINFQHYFSDAEYEMSFPNWFNDTLVRNNKIKTITRSVFMSSREKNQNLEFPKEVKRYHFNEDGEILYVEIEQYYENVKVGDLRYEYKGNKDEMGFAFVKKKKLRRINSDETDDHFNVYEKEKYGEKFLVYRNENSGDYLFFMLSEENWGPLSVDSILAPNPKDVVVLGHPLTPAKKYQVENTVNETHAVDFKYDKTRKYPLVISFDEYPFHYKRSILYDKNGQCTGFVDSTFSDDRYLTRRNSKLNLIGSLPSLVTHEKKSSSSDEMYFQFEKLEYEFYE